MAICVGDEFEVAPDGRLKVKICGTPADVEPCAATDNILKRGAACGLHVPRSKVVSLQAFDSQAFPNVLVPVAETTVKSFQLNVPNPDQCRPAVINVEFEIDVTMDLPPGGRGAYGFGTNEHVQFDNKGSSTITDAHNTGTKVFWGLATIPPAGNAVITLDVTLRDGLNGARYNNVETVIRTQALIL